MEHWFVLSRTERKKCGSENFRKNKTLLKSRCLFNIIVILKDLYEMGLTGKRERESICLYVMYTY